MNMCSSFWCFLDNIPHALALETVLLKHSFVQKIYGVVTQGQEWFLLEGAFPQIIT